MPEKKCPCCRGDARRRVLAEVATRGFAVRWRSGGRRAVDVVSTAGLTAAGLPELVAMHHARDLAAEVVTAMAERLLEGEQVDDGADVQGLLDRGLAVRLHAVTVGRAPAHVARGLYGEVAGRQLLLPDDAGRFSYEAGYEGDRVPLLFAPPSGCYFGAQQVWWDTWTEVTGDDDLRLRRAG